MDVGGYADRQGDEARHRKGAESAAEGLKAKKKRSCGVYEMYAAAWPFFLLLPIVKICGNLLPVLPILAYAAAFACFFRGFAHAGK